MKIRDTKVPIPAPFNPNSGKQLEPIFKNLGIEYERNEPTPKMLEKDLMESTEGDETRY